MAKQGLHRHHIPALFSYRCARKIGLLGGSFNPGHEGHIALSQKARQVGQLDQIWWLVSPQNPLKTTDDMADFQERLTYARDLVSHIPFIKVVDVERQFSNSYSYNCVRLLQKRSPKAQFTWLMGSDNLVQFPRWYKARDMASLLPFMIFRRGPSFYPALCGKGRSYFRHPARGVKRNPKIASLAIISSFRNNSSATALRQSGFWDNRP